jgi:Protein of unknown function (DUF3619)
MDQSLDLKTIKALLNQSAEKLNPSVLNQLQYAREQALQPRTVHQTHRILAGVMGGWSAYFHTYQKMQWVAVGLLMASIFSGATYWQHSLAHHDNDEVDIAILTDELPVDVYVD